jgi:Flp pilus assembly protein TadD
MYKAWKLLTQSSLVTGSLITAVFVSGCATPKAAKGPAGLPAQQLHNIAEPTSSSWLPKFMQPGPAQPKFGGGDSGTISDLSSPAPTSPKNGKPKKIEALSMARLHEKRGQFEQAVKIYERELATSPKKAHIHHRLAVISAREGKWDKSREHFTEACRLEPRNSEILGDLGYALYLQHELTEAEACLLAAVDANPRNKAAQNNLGIVQGVLGKYDESLEAFRRAVPEAEAHANLGYVHMQLGDAEKAMGELNQALNHDSSLKTAAVALVQLNDLKQRLSPKDLDKMLIAGQQPAARAATPENPVAPVQPVPQYAATSSNLPVSGAPLSETNSRAVPTYAATDMPIASPVDQVPSAPVDSRISELPVRLPAPSSFVNLSGLGTSPPAAEWQVNKPITVASKPVVSKPIVSKPVASQSLLATAAPVGHRTTDQTEPSEPVIQASVLSNMAPALLAVPESAPLVEAKLPQASTQPAPVFTPSARIQQSRQEWATIVAKSNAQKLERPSSAQQIIATSGNPTSHQVTSDKVSDGSPERNELGAAVTSAQAAGARTSVVQPNSGATPSLVPQVAMPRPEDMLPAQSQMSQMATHQLHPTAHPTWTAPHTPTPANSSRTKGTKSPLPRVKVMPE